MEPFDDNELYNEQDKREQEELMAQWRERVQREDYSQWEAIASMAENDRQ